MKAPGDNKNSVDAVFSLYMRGFWIFVGICALVIIASAFRDMF